MRICDLPVIEAEAVERGLQPADILLRARDQREWGHRRLLAQAQKVGAAGQRLVERAIAGGRDGDGVGLRIGGAGVRLECPGSRRQRA